MNKKGYGILLYSLLAGLLLLYVPVRATATSGAGGQVPTEAKITFYESEASSSSEPAPSESSSSSEPIPSSEPVPSSTTFEAESSSYAATSTKPQGSYPSTGEIVQRYSWIGGGALLAAGLIVWMRQRRKGGSQ